jgi:hypothetical protein
MIVHLRRNAKVNIAAIAITTKPIAVRYSFEVTIPITAMTRRTTHHQSSTLLDCVFIECPGTDWCPGILMICGISTMPG